MCYHGRYLSIGIIIVCLLGGQLPADVIILKNGEKRQGKIVSYTRETVLLLTPQRQFISIPRSHIVKIDKESVARPLAKSATKTPPQVQSTPEPAKRPRPVDLQGKAKQEIDATLKQIARIESSLQRGRLIARLAQKKAATAAYLGSLLYREDYRQYQKWLCYALLKIDNSEARYQLYLFVKKRGSQAPFVVIEKLGSYRHAGVIDVLSGLLSAEHVGIKLQAIRALARHQRVEAVAPFAALSSRPGPCRPFSSATGPGKV